MLKKIRHLIFRPTILNTGRFLLLVFFISIIQSGVHAQTKELLEAQKEKLEEQISLTNTYLKKSKKNKNLAQDEFNALSAQIKTRKRLLTNIKDQLKEHDQSISSKQNELIVLQASKRSLHKNYKKLIQLAYRHKLANRNWVSLFSAKSMKEAYVRLRYAYQFEKYVKQQSQRMEGLILDINETIQKIEETQTKKQFLLQEETQSQTVLQNDLTKKSKLVSTLKNQISSYESKIKEKEAERNDLDKQIARIIRAEMEAIRLASNNNRNVDLINISKGFIANKGVLPWPVDHGILLHTFGVRTHPANVNIKIKNDGIDIQTGSNAQVKSIFKGVVASVSAVPGYQNIVIITTGEHFVVYGHLQAVVVEKGATIALGQIIGTLAEENGKSILQLQIWKNQTKLDPQLWLEKR